jgi:putative transposase
MGQRRRRRRRRVEPTDDWEQLELLCAWDEQREYERIRPLLLFGVPVPERALQTGTSERTLYRRISGFEQEGMESLFGSPPAKRRILPDSIRRLIVDLKAEHPALNDNEIANICYVFSGRKPDARTVGNVLDEEPLPLKAFRRFDPYHEIEEARERRKAVVTLHYEGWTDKSIARGTSRWTAQPSTGCSDVGWSRVRRDSRTGSAGGPKASGRWISGRWTR